MGSKFHEQVVDEVLENQLVKVALCRVVSESCKVDLLAENLLCSHKACWTRVRRLTIRASVFLEGVGLNGFRGYLLNLIEVYGNFRSTN